MQNWIGEPFSTDTNPVPKIENESYKEQIRKLEPRLNKLISDIKSDKFKNKCLFFLKKKSKQNWKKFKACSIIVLCIKDDETVKRQEFLDILNESYSKYVIDSKDLMKLQSYGPDSTIKFQFYDPAIKMEETVLPNYFIRFTEEGYVLSTEMVN